MNSAIILKIETLCIYFAMSMLVWEYVDKQLGKKKLGAYGWETKAIKTFQIISLTLLTYGISETMSIPYVRFIVWFIYIYAWTIVANKGTIMIKMFVVITVLLIVGVGDIIGSIMVLKNNNTMNVAVLKETGIIKLLALLIGVLVMGVIINVIIRYKNYKVDKLTKTDNIILVLPGIVNIITLFIILQDDMLNCLTYGNNMRIIMGLIMNITVLGTVDIYLFEKLLQGVTKKKENDVMRQQMDLQYEYYLSTQKTYQESRKLWHDMKNHLMCVDNLIREGEYEDAVQYLQDVRGLAEELSYSVKTGNNILDIIINSKVLECKKNDIDMSIKVNFPESINMEFIDICTIYGNALDNAIEACKVMENKATKKRIAIKTTLVNSFLVIKITNTFSGQIKKEREKIVTTKQDKNCHGIGLKNICYAVDKYEGELKIDYTDTEFSLTIIVPQIKKRA